HRNFPGLGVAQNPTAFFGQPSCIGSAPFSGSLCDGNSQVGTLAARVLGGNTVANDQAVANPVGGLWSNGFARLNPMLGQVPRTGAQNIIFPKLDWQINQANHASFSFNRMRWSSPAGIQTQATNTNGIASFGDDFVKDTWGVAKLDTMFTPNLANQLRFQYGRDFEYEFTQQPTPYEVANLVNSPRGVNPKGLPAAVSIGNGGFTFGVPTFLQRSAFPDEARLQTADTLMWTHGKHTWKFGLDIGHVNDLSQNLRNEFGSYSYPNVLAYLTDFYVPRGCTPSTAPATATPSQPCYNSNGFTQAFGPQGFEFQTNDFAIFAADDWKIFNHLSLS